MPHLKLKIPPPIVLLLIALAMWAVSLISPADGPRNPARVAAAVVIALMGGGIDLFSVISFRRARTTVNPMKPEKTSALVTAGAYGYSRNPMYVGLLIILVAWAVFLGSLWALFGPSLFMVYINRFQIVPEEDVLAATFGADYSTYKANVRRWL